MAAWIQSSYFQGWWWASAGVEGGAGALLRLRLLQHLLSISQALFHLLPAAAQEAETGSPFAR